VHNDKQIKVPLRKEGVNPKRVADGELGKEGVLMWLPSGGDRYMPFEERDWKDVEGGTARL
jgi:hypothetical protein